MVDTIGRQPIGRSIMSGKKRKLTIAKVRLKQEQWRDKARQKLLEQRRRYKSRVEKNEALMKSRKEGRERNLNPSSVAIVPSQNYAKLIRNPDHLSTVPAKPRYSKVMPRMRIYGKKRWKLLERGQVK